MEFQHYFTEGLESDPHPISQSNNTSSPCFDCSICLDSARDPVVTLCGHLYCWPCIYKWLNSQTTSPASDEPPRCPVCKSKISPKTVVPLYVHGANAATNGIPPRPPAFGTIHPGQQLLSDNPYMVNPLMRLARDDNLMGSAPSVINHPTVKMFGEMVCARVFSLYMYPNSYDSVVSSTPRLRRQQITADKSLNRVTVFLLCFAILCLVVF